MLKLNFISIHPDFVMSYFSFGVYSQAQKKGLANIATINLRNFAIDKRGSIDDRPYGGGDGMLMRPEPLAQAVESLGKPLVILTSPQGQRFDQAGAAELLRRANASPDGVVFVCGRFGGVDQRFIDEYVDLEISLGDFILSGGELAALAIGDSMLRLVPGVLGHEDSSRYDSFSPELKGHLEHPQYTRPEVFHGLSVPKELLSGDHAKIRRFRTELSEEVTKAKRPDLLS